MTNYEKIKNMSVKEMAKFLWKLECCDAYNAYFNGEEAGIKWLKSEAEE